MPWATSQVSATLIGHSRSSGASIQSRISPKRERCSCGMWTPAPGSRGPGPPAQRAVYGGGWSARPARVRGRSGGDLLEAVAEAAHRRDADRTLLDLLAQAVDVDLDRVVADFLAPFAQAGDELVLADETAGALQQHLEQADLARGQLDHLVVYVGDATGGVEG